MTEEHLKILWKEIQLAWNRNLKATKKVLKCQEITHWNCVISVSVVLWKKNWYWYQKDQQKVETVCMIMFGLLWKQQNLFSFWPWPLDGHVVAYPPSTCFHIGDVDELGFRSSPCGFAVMFQRALRWCRDYSQNDFGIHSLRHRRMTESLPVLNRSRGVTYRDMVQVSWAALRLFALRILEGSGTGETFLAARVRF